MKVNLKDNKENSNVTTYRNAKEVIVSHAKNVHKANLQTSNLFWVFRSISQTTWKSKVEKIRKETDKDKRKQLKEDTLGYFNIGEFRDNYRNNKSFIRSEFMLFDFDDLGEELKTKAEFLKTNAYVYALFISPSGDGLKVIYRLDTPVTDKDQFSKIYKAQAKTLGASLSSDADKTSDASRPCYFSYDPDIYINERALPLRIGELKKEIGDAEKRNENSADRDELLAILGGVKEGGRNTALTQFAGLCISKGFDQSFTKTFASIWNLKNDPPLPADEIDKTVENLYISYAEENKMPSSLVHYKEENNRYVKLLKEEEREISSFILEPKELLILNDSDCMKVKVITDKGFEYDNVLLENTDWHTKGKFLKALGHQDCVFLGSDNDLLGLCNYLNARVERRITGTKIIGLHEGNTWVTENVNITKDGKQPDLKIVPYSKGGDAFYHKIRYSELSQDETESLIRGFYNNVTRINNPETILPWIGWLFSSPVKPALRTIAGGFPLMFVHGGQGSGKTSTAGIIMRLLGYNDPKPFSCTMRSFPILKLLSSTNAIPVILDEFKKSDMTKEQTDDLLRYMRKAYSGEVESKGRPDQTVEDYTLDAPLTVMGEWDINQPALKERVLVSRFTSAVKEDKEMQKAFSELKTLALEGFMPEYIKFLLGMDVEETYNRLKKKVEDHFSGVTVAPRVLNNLTVLAAGLEFFRIFGEEWGCSVPSINVESLLDSQLNEITGSKNGSVKSAVDQLIEELAVMALKGDLISDKSFISGRKETIKVGNVRFDQMKLDESNKYNDPDFRVLTINDQNHEPVNVVAIKFNSVYPKFKEYARKTGYEGDLLDKESYKRLFDESPYVVSKNQSVRFGRESVRSLCIDYEKAREKGLNLEGLVFDYSKIEE